MTRLLCSAAKAGRGVSHQMAWIESGEAAEGRDQRRGKDNENRHDPHLETRHRPSCKLLHGNVQQATKRREGRKIRN